MTDSFDERLEPLLEVENSDEPAKENGAAPATVAEKPTQRDLQRSALRDLTLLATECATTEADIERKRKTALDETAKQLERGKWEAQQRLTASNDAVKQKVSERMSRDDAQARADLKALKSADVSARERVARETDPPQREIRKKYEQAIWLTDSVFDTTQDQARAEIQIAKAGYAEQVEMLDSVEVRALNLMSTFGVKPFDVPDPHAPIAPAAGAVAPAVALPAAITPAPNAASAEPTSSPAGEAVLSGTVPPSSEAGIAPNTAGAAAAPVDMPAAGPLPAPEEAAAEYAKRRDVVEHDLRALANQRLARMFVGARPILAMILLCALAAVATQFHFHTVQPQVKALEVSVGSTFGVLLILGFGLSLVGKSQVRKVYVPLRVSLYDARRAARTQLDSTVKSLEVKLADAAELRKREVAATKHKFTPMVDKIKAIRDAGLKVAAAQNTEGLARIDAQRKKARAEVEEWQQKHLAEYQQRFERDQTAIAERQQAALATIDQQYNEARADLEHRLRDGLAYIQAPIAGAGVPAAGMDGYTPRDWNDPRWKDWKPPQKFAELVRFGELEVDLKKIADSVPRQVPAQLVLPEAFSMPALLAFPRQASLLIQTDRQGRAEALRVLQMLMLRLLTSLPAGRVRFHIIDPVGLGQNFAGFMHLADYDDALVGGRILTDAEQIEKRLADLTEHMETVIQKYLRNEFETIDDYNAQAGELAEPYRFLVIADFPVAFQGDAFRRLSSIVTSGARCGVYVLIARDTRQSDLSETHLDDLEAHCVNIVQNDEGRLVWKDEIFQKFPLSLDPPASEDVLTEMLHIVGTAAKESKRVEVPFDIIAPSAKDFWAGSTASELVVPIGRMGATRLQMMRVGRGVAQHTLIAGKTGSGKSTLLNLLITNLAMWYSPDEVEFYLIDFKKGVEFKAYATNALPHARAIAVESDREFGISVLQQLDAELTRRGVLYRNFGVQDLKAYRQAAAKDAAPMPRTLLIIDEFQEFFSEDDKIAQEASLLLDRLVRQGRAFGMHVLLGSQTIGGASGISRATLGQMAIRIALMCSEADSQLILGDNNSAARLLTRPGEAIYNDVGGLVEGNSPFQIAWLSDEQRERYLQVVHQRDLARPRGKNDTRQPPLVFEGNAPADINKNAQLNALLDALLACVRIVANGMAG